MIAESFERIHRSNLVNMGVLPLQFKGGETAASLKLTGTEEYSLLGAGSRVEAARRRPRAGEVRRRQRARIHRDGARRHTRGAGGIPPRRNSSVRRQATRISQLTCSRQMRIKAKARQLGFDLCGIAPADNFPELTFLEEWLAHGYAGEMAYMARSAERRADVRNVVPGARSVIVTGTIYATPSRSPVMTRLTLSRSHHWSRHHLT